MKCGRFNEEQPCRADAGGVEMGKRCMIEMLITHRCNQEKIRP
jgi:hypothetical protein